MVGLFNNYCGEYVKNVWFVGRDVQRILEQGMSIGMLYIWGR